MNPLNKWSEEAIRKLEEGKKNVNGQKEKAMAHEVAAQLEFFCRQDTEFAQAVVQGGTFSGCMKKVAKGVGSSISDLEAYKRAVRFYFPGATVKMQLTIDLIGKAADPEPVAEEPKQENKAIVLDLDLSDFF